MFVLWFAATLGTLAASIAAGGINTIDAFDDPNGPKLESEVAYDVLGAGETTPPAERLVVVIDGGAGAAADPAFQQHVHELVADLTAAKATVDGAETATFDSVIDPFVAGPKAGLISPDGTTVQVVGNIPGEDPVVEQKLVPVPAIVDAAKARMPGADIHIVSSTFINRDFNQVITDELDGSLKFTIPITFLILLIAFGAIVASLVPLVLAVTSLAAGYGLLGLYSHAVGPVSANAAQLVILMGLAVAVDYSLFMLTRFRSERQRGVSVVDSVETSSSTA
ncbi:MAG: MMPL family transporter, partial [Chloroflexota bacterium]